MAAIANAIWSLIIVAMKHLTDVGDVIAKQFSNNRSSLALGQMPHHQPLAACDWVAGSTVSPFEFILLQMRSYCQLFCHMESIHPKLVLQRALDWLLDLIKTNPGLALSLAMGISVGILSGWAVDNMEGSIVWNNGKITINIKGGLISIENLTICFSNCNNSDNHVEQHNHYYPPPIVPTSAPIIIYPTQAPTLLSATVTPTLQATSVVTPSVPSTISTGTPSGSVPTQPPIITVVQNGNPTDTGIIVAGGHRETATQQPVDQPGGSTEVPETPTPETPTPETPTPETPTPETPTPETPTPETPTPETPTPETPTPFMRIFGVDDEGARGLRFIQLDVPNGTYKKYRSCGNLDGEGGDIDHGKPYVVTNESERGPATLNLILDMEQCLFQQIVVLSRKGEVTAVDIRDSNVLYWVQGDGLWSYNLITQSNTQLLTSRKNVEGLTTHNNEIYVAAGKTLYRLIIEQQRGIFIALASRPKGEIEALDELPDGTIAVAVDGEQWLYAYSSQGQLMWQIELPFEDIETLWWVPLPQ